MTSETDSINTTPREAMLAHDLSWHYGEVDRRRTVITRAVNILTGPRWPGDNDPYITVIRILQDALKPNSTVGRDQ